ncbi:hypothetical protein SAMN05216466_10786 [Paraburkholderia phenazinium]|uniref:Uncharacterized protein n=1 Tax=Paraburkholderia phenazinium TaxID=60549 RepID=A0A1G7ZM99_9BURK|nr:hypothetical protein [Paraburkholderia phenazinium]SDH09696.1 hypothetical protein SAMN05216466_10786 [Paraburkholderia phenazinium]
MINFNPALTSAPQNTFVQSTEGYVGGTFFDDPSTKNWLMSGVVAASVTQPVWGGMAITEEVATVNANALGNSLVLASAAGNFTGMTVFNQANNMVIIPGNSVQQAVAGMTVNFFRTGSNARIAVSVLSSIVATLDSGAINQTLYWDPALQQLTASGASGAFALPATTRILSLNSNSQIVSYNSGTGALTWTSGAAAMISI